MLISPLAVLADRAGLGRGWEGEAPAEPRLRFFFSVAAGSPCRDDLFLSFAGEFGISRTTSFAGLSSRRPWNDGCRRRSSEVHSLNTISPTSSGFTQVTPRLLYPLGGFLNGDLSIF